MNKIIWILLALLFCINCNAEILEDEVVKTLPRYPIKPVVHNKYNYEDTEKIPIKLRIQQSIISENQVYEGQEIHFELVRSVIYKGKVIAKKGSTVCSKVSLAVTPGMNGIPASIVFKDFIVPNIKSGQITDSYEVFGQDRSLFVFPLKWALTPLPPTGSLTNFIKGGHAKLNTKKTITIYYYPNWI